MTPHPLTATVSGSFRRAMSAVQDAVYALTDAGVKVLSPADPRVVDWFGDFLFVASDRHRSLKLVQHRHLAAIESSDFVWLEAPEGYIGQSGAMEIGYAEAVGTPVYASETPTDLTLRQYVTPLASPLDAIRAVRGQPARPAPLPNILLDPESVVRDTHAQLDHVGALLLNSATHSHLELERAAKQIDLATKPLRS